ncbi:hypothetical protein Bca52824_042895 [Brassica carinata]|uniref:Uncharacterized protein n=1 Tax=Brassica carinata TaxID=52824 RepID=A0A8X7V1E5_BRACI|nr:hypothetical protein Bca52824_042895 [Brassica carinata]
MLSSGAGESYSRWRRDSKTNPFIFFVDLLCSYLLLCLFPCFLLLKIDNEKPCSVQRRKSRRLLESPLAVALSFWVVFLSSMASPSFNFGAGSVLSRESPHSPFVFVITSHRHNSLGLASCPAELSVTNYSSDNASLAQVPTRAMDPDTPDLSSHSLIIDSQEYHLSAASPRHSNPFREPLIHLVSSENFEDVGARAVHARSTSFQTLLFGLINVDYDHFRLVVVTYSGTQLMLPMVLQLPSKTLLLALLSLVLVFCFYDVHQTVEDPSGSILLLLNLTSNVIA